MELKVYWSDFAIQKLYGINQYYLSSGEAIAQKMTEGIIDTTVHLSSLPNMGQVEELLKDKFKEEFRYLVFRQYKIIYLVNIDEHRVDIVNVFDCRQNPTKMIDELEL